MGSSKKHRDKDREHRHKHRKRRSRDRSRSRSRGHRHGDDDVPREKRRDRKQHREEWEEQYEENEVSSTQPSFVDDHNEILNAELAQAPPSPVYEKQELTEEGNSMIAAVYRQLITKLARHQIICMSTRPHC